MKILFATDHAGFELKNILVDFVSQELGFEVNDFGAFEYDESDDFPDFIRKVAEAISNNSEDRAIILGGSGQGEAMLANRYTGVRSAVYYGGNEEIVRLSRQHNNANILSLGARFIEPEEAKLAIKVWLETDFSGEDRHLRRIAALDK